jgi:hypothetical protein
MMSVLTKEMAHGRVLTSNIVISVEYIDQRQEAAAEEAAAEEAMDSRREQVQEQGEDERRRSLIHLKKKIFWIHLRR